MSEKIEPALSAEQWAELVVELPDEHAWTEPGYLCANDNDRWGTSRVPAHIAIALANAALPDDDPRKITRKMVTGLREIASDQPWDEGLGLWLNRVADVLESFLPPEGT